MSLFFGFNINLIPFIKRTVQLLSIYKSHNYILRKFSCLKKKLFLPILIESIFINKTKITSTKSNYVN